MKKLIAMILSVSIIMANAAVMAETTEVEGLHEKLSALILENNFTDEQIADMDRQYVEYFNELWPGQLEGYKFLGKMQTGSDEEEYEYRLNQERPNFSYGIKTTLLSIAPNYAKQYADANSFDYLFSDNEFWLISCGGERTTKYELNGNHIESMQETFNIRYYGIIIHSEDIEIVKNEEYIKNLLIEKNETKVEDIKFFALSSNVPFLYIRCAENEYLINLYAGTGWEEDMEDFERYKLYSAKEVMEVLGQERPNTVGKEKPTYETEAESLQSRGLLRGNENGLDLLKPLTRIEAATMLLRAMGESTESEAQVQTFTDVSSTHWGYGAAENAYALGLIKGIGDGLFAPEDMVTGAQFATMLLRAGNHAEFNWEEALNIMINEGIISSENAATMDFFTRGDMAKIIYEAIEKGLF